MGIVTTEREQVCAVAPARLFKAMAFDFGNVLPKAIPNLVKSAEIIGDGGPGSIKKIVLANGKFRKNLVRILQHAGIFHIRGETIHMKNEFNSNKNRYF